MTLDPTILRALLERNGLPWTRARDGFETSETVRSEYGRNSWQPINDECASPEHFEAERELVLAIVNAAPVLLDVFEAACAYLDAETVADADGFIPAASAFQHLRAVTNRARGGAR